jgi:hypothetical protein
MAPKLNHTIVAARDRNASALFLSEILALEAPLVLGPFALVKIPTPSWLRSCSARALLRAAQVSEGHRPPGDIRRGFALAGPNGCGEVRGERSLAIVAVRQKHGEPRAANPPRKLEQV